MPKKRNTNTRNQNTKVCFRTLDLYTSAVLEAGLDAPPPPKAEWRALMDRLGRASCAVYRAYVFERPDFVEYFNLATPAQVPCLRSLLFGVLGRVCV